MSEFERARERAERKLAKKGVEINSAPVEEVEIPIPPCGVVYKAPKKRSNEITVSVWIDGNEYVFSMKANITGTILATQHSSKGMQHIILEALRAKFGIVELI